MWARSSRPLRLGMPVPVAVALARRACAPAAAAARPCHGWPRDTRVAGARSTSNSATGSDDRAGFPLRRTLTTVESSAAHRFFLDAEAQRNEPTARVAFLEGENVFAQFSALNDQHGAINLGQGFPSFAPPAFLLDAACEAVRAGFNQYTRPGGHPELVQALAGFYTPLLGRHLDPMTEVVTCNGAQEGIFVCISSFCSEGDEVVSIEPYAPLSSQPVGPTGCT